MHCAVRWLFRSRARGRASTLRSGSTRASTPLRTGGLLALSLAIACGSGTAAPTPEASTASVRGPVVARVDGDPIGLAEVQQLCSVTGLPAHEAHERLVSERLLVRHASAQGYGELAVVERAAAQARVRALLAQTVEASGAPAPLAGRPEAARAAPLAQQKAELDRLLAQLAQKTRVAYDEAAIQQAFKRERP